MAEKHADMPINKNLGKGYTESVLMALRPRRLHKYKGGSMPRHVLIDEFHLSLLIPHRLSDSEQRVIRRTLGGQRFRSRLYKAARSVVRRFPTLNRIRLTLSR